MAMRPGDASVSAPGNELALQLNGSDLAKTIADNIVSNYNTNKAVGKVTVTKTRKNSDGDGVETYTENVPGIPKNDEIKALAAAIGKAVATAIIDEIKAKLELDTQSATVSQGNMSGQWQGSGGGVVGPVLVTAGSQIAGSEQIKIPEGKFK